MVGIMFPGDASLLHMPQTALLNPETPLLFQQRHSYTRNLKSETPGKMRLYVVELY